MSELSLDEYRLMMGTQMWIKESIFGFIESLLGVDNNSTSSISNSLNPDSESLNSLLKMTEKLEGKTTNNVRKSKVSKLDDSKLDDSIKNDISEIRNNFKKSLTKKEDNDDDNINLNNISLLINDSSSRRDDKSESLLNKIKHYKKAGYIK